MAKIAKIMHYLQFHTHTRAIDGNPVYNKKKAIAPAVLFLSLMSNYVIKYKFYNILVPFFDENSLKMGKIMISHTNLKSWPSKEISMSKIKYTSQFVSVIHEPMLMPKKIDEKKLKSPRPTYYSGKQLPSRK